jgi:hypothetical protein
MAGWSMFAAISLVITLAAQLQGDTITIQPLKDNTLYQSTSGTLSNAKGDYFFVGLTAQSSNRIRRGLLNFNIAGAIPAGSTINNVSLRLWCSTGVSGGIDIELHKLLQDWGEGTSNAGGEEGSGGTATTGDATWVHTFRTTQLWTTVGGTFSPTISAVQNVNDSPVYFTWTSTPQFVADVQGWLDNPATNFGWILKSSEAPGGATAKRFNTREFSDPTLRPALTISFSPPAPPVLLGDMNCDSSVNLADVDPFVLALISPDEYAAAFPGCDLQHANMNADSTVDALDIDGFIGAMGL